MREILVARVSESKWRMHANDRRFALLANPSAVALQPIIHHPSSMTSQADLTMLDISGTGYRYH